jgi:uncharacterized protein (TIGR02145 family)
MAENLNVGIRIDGIQEQTNNGIIEKYCYNDDVNNCDVYGGLYQWTEMMAYETTAGVQGICPTGWHIPTDGEWCTVTQFLDPTVDCGYWGTTGTNAGGKMKETGTARWWDPNTGATNESGFTAVGGGYREFFGPFLYLGNGGFFWSSSQYTSYNALYWRLSYNITTIKREGFGKDYGLSVRCIRD